MKLQQVAGTALFSALIFLLEISPTFQQRVAPGVNPQHYQQVPVQQHPQHPPQYQQQQQQHHGHAAPGVAPQQYQQYQQVPVQQQQYQQVPVQQQQPQQHQQPQVVQQQPQVVQQQPQVVQQQHQQVHQQHPPQPAHHGHHGQQQVLNTANIEHERAHIQEHMQVPIDTSKMSEAELQFHYFKMHDSDNNNKLDGCELIKSLIHWHADDTKHGDAHEADHGAEAAKEKEEGTGHKDGTIYTDQGLSDVIDYVLKTMDLNNDGYVDYTEYRKTESKVGTD